MKQRIIRLNTLLLSAFILFSNVASFGSNWTVEPGKHKAFIENKGQFNVRHASLSNKKILFAVDEPCKLIYFTTEGVIYHFYSFKKNPNRKKGDHSKPKIVTEHEFFEMKWQGASSGITYIPEGLQADQHTYSLLSKGNEPATSVNNIKGYDRILAKNIYPGIDVEYSFHPQGGIKYNLLLQPGADPALIKMVWNASASPVLLTDGNIELSGTLGKVIEKAPLSFYTGSSASQISSSFELNGSSVSFKMGNYNRRQAVTIDPWVQTPSFATSWDCIWEVEEDAAGNVYAIGGIMPMQILKYNAAGNLQWTYNTPYDTATVWLGTFAVDRAGNSYVTAGSVAKIQKVSTNGTLVWDNPSPGGIFSSTEFWNISFNCDETRLIIGGAGGFLPPVPYIYEVNMNNGNITSSLQISGGALIPTQEIRSLTASGNGRYYYLTHDSIGFINQRFSVCPNPSSAVFRASNGYTLGYKCEDYRFDNSGIMAVKTYGAFAFTHRGNEIHKRDFSTGNIVATAAIPGGGFATGFGNSVQNSGIDIDSCGNIYVGSRNQVVKFDQNLSVLATYPTTFNVYDVHVSTAGNIIAGGSTGTSSTSNRTGSVQHISAGACAPIAIVCCDANICRPANYCATDPPITLVVSSPGGTFSGPGITNASTGVFSPAAAGPGTHTIIYRLPCGADSVRITVSPCTALSVCLEPNGNLTASGGVGPFTWQRQTTTQDCSACFPAVPPLIPACSTPPGCAVNVLTWTTFTTGNSATPPGTFPIRVLDAFGTTLVINSLAGILPCTNVCPPITVSPSVTQQVSCPGLNNGSVSVSQTGGTAPYTYTWSPAAGTGATASNLSPGTYLITVTDVNNCTGTGTITLATPQSPALSLGTIAAPLCNSNNGQINFSVAGGLPPYTLRLENNSGTILSSQNLAAAGNASFSNLNAGSYVVRVLGSNNCPDTLQITISSANGPQINAVNVQNEVCAGASDGQIVSISAVVPSGILSMAYARSSNPAAQTPVAAFPVNGLAPGSYLFFVSDSLGCRDTLAFSINAGPLCCNIQIAINSLSPNCGLSDGSISLSITPPGTYTFNWSNSLPATSSQSNLPAGLYTVSVSDANCTVDTFIALSNSNAPIINQIIRVNETCPGTADGSLEIIASGGTGTLAYQWASGPSSAIYTGLTAGAYAFTVTDSLNCQTPGIAVMLANLCCTLSGSASVTDTRCGLNNGSISAGILRQGIPPYQYSLNGSAFSATSSWNNLASGAYTLVVRDSINCADTLNLSIAASTAISLQTGSRNPDCAGGNNGSVWVIVSGATAPVFYTWNLPSVFLNDTLTQLSAGTYRVTVTDNLGCSKDTLIVLTDPAADTLNLQDVSVCESTPVTLDAGAGFVSYLWSTNDTTQTIQVQQSGNYSVIVTNTLGCQSTDAVLVTLNARPLVSLGSDFDTYRGDYRLLVSTVNGIPNSPGTYLWQPSDGLSCDDCASPYFTATDTVTYTLAYTDPNGCSGSDTLVIFVFPSGYFFFPNAFTPNGDGINDILFPLGQSIKNISWKVFNRWGEKVFESRNLNIGWDGTFKGKDQPNGVYIYLAEVSFQDNSTQFFKGGLTLLR